MSYTIKSATEKLQAIAQDAASPVHSRGCPPHVVEAVRVLLSRRSTPAPARRQAFNLVVQEYRLRRSRASHPAGAFDAAGRWTPDEDTEARQCCAEVRPPSRAYPLSLSKHCRSIPHLARLFTETPEQAAQLAKELRAATRPARTAERQIRYKAVAVVDGEFVSIYDGSPWPLGKTRREALPKLSAVELELHPGQWPHDGGFYLYETPEEAASRNHYPKSCAHGDAPRVVLKCEVWGTSRAMGHGKEAWSHCKPIDEVEVVA